MYKIFTKQSGLASGHFGKILLIMRLTTVILLATLIQVSAATFGQSITLKARNMPLEKLLKEIRKQSGYDFYYDVPLIKKASSVTLDVKGLPIEDVLDQSFKNQALTYKIENKLVMVKAKEPSFLDMFVNAFDRIDVRGRVFTEKGEPLPGATVKIKGTNISLTTSNDGGFFIANIDDKAILIISFIGYKTKEVKAARELGTIQLEIASSDLEEVNVAYNTGYQQIIKERSVGAIAQVGNELYNRKISGNVLDRIYDVTSGLIYEPTYDTGNNRFSPITIRGVSSITAGKSPLIVLDNFPYDGDLSNLNPNDIESVTVLKDAAAASIWGVRAGNGVIVINTKKGRFNQKGKIQFNSNYTIGQRPNLDYIPTLNPSEYLEIEQKLVENNAFSLAELYSQLGFPIYPLSKGADIFIAKRDGTITEAEAEKELQALRGNDVKRDINKYLLQNSVNQQYALNLSGGSQKVNYYGSLGYDKEKSHNIGNTRSRLTLRLDNSFLPMKNLEINTNVNLIKSEMVNNGLNYLSFMPLGNALAISNPYTALTDASGNPAALPKDYRTIYVDTARSPNLLDWHYRPLDEQRLNDNLNKEYDARISAGAKYTLFPGLNIDVKYQYQKAYTSEKNLQSINSYYTRNLVNQFMFVNTDRSIVYPIPVGDILDKGSNDLSSWNLRGQLNFNKTIGRHNVSVLGGYELRETNVDQTTTRTYGYRDDLYLGNNSIDYLTTFDLRPFSSSTIRAINNPINFGGTLNRYRSYFGNASYNFQDKYTLYASGRVDASNFFGVNANQRFVPLWSIGTAWELSKEDFFRINWVSYLKIRASLGYNGNTNNSATSYTTVSIGAVNQVGALVGDILSAPNPYLKWEKVRMLNLGIDFDILKGRLSGAIDLYTKRGVDLIGQYNVDYTSGVVASTGNVANMKGKGIDFTANSINLKGPITWSTNLLFSINTNEVTKYNYRQTPNLYIVDNTLNPLVGKPLYSVLSYRWGGLDPQTGDPRGYVGEDIAKYTDAYSKLTVDDIVYSGSARPTVFGSFRNTFSWRDLSISANIIYKLNYVFRRRSADYGKLFNVYGDAFIDYKYRWQKSGDELTTTIPSLPSVIDNARESLYNYSEILIEKGDHIRLQDIKIGYDFSRSRYKWLPFQKIQLYGYCNNLGIIWRANKLGIDPDYYSQGSVIPPSKSFAFGLNVEL